MMSPLRLAALVQFWLFLAVCTVLGLMQDPSRLMITGDDLVLHSCGYLLLLLSARIAGPLRPATPVLVALLLGYSLLIEIGQQFVPGRSFELKDLAANAVGLAGGALLWACARYAGLTRRWERAKPVDKE